MTSSESYASWILVWQLIRRNSLIHEIIVVVKNDGNAFIYIPAIFYTVKNFVLN